MNLITWLFCWLSNDKETTMSITVSGSYVSITKERSTKFKSWHTNLSQYRTTAPYNGHLSDRTTRSIKEILRNWFGAVESKNEKTDGNQQCIVASAAEGSNSTSDFQLCHGKQLNGRVSKPTPATIPIRWLQFLKPTH